MNCWHESCCCAYRSPKCCCWCLLCSCYWTFPVTLFASTSSSSQPSTHRTYRVIFSSLFRKSFSISSTSTSPLTSCCTASAGRRSGAPRTGWCGARSGVRRCGRGACGNVDGRWRWLSLRTSLSSRHLLNLLTHLVPVNCSETFHSSHPTTNIMYFLTS